MTKTNMDLHQAKSKMCLLNSIKIHHHTPHQVRIELYLSLNQMRNTDFRKCTYFDFAKQVKNTIKIQESMHQELLTHHQVCFNESLKFKIPNIQFYGVPISIYLQETKSSYQHRLDQIQFVLHVCYFIFKKSCVPIFLILINKCTTFLLRSELSCYD